MVFIDVFQRGPSDSVINFNFETQANKIMLQVTWSRKQTTTL